MMRHLMLLVLASSLAGCGWINGLMGGKDNAEPPAPLTDVTNQIAIKPLWSRQVGSGYDKQFVNLAPSVDGGTVYAADRRGRVAAFDAQTGKELWETASKAPFAGGPGVGDGLVLLGTSDAGVLAFGAQDGKMRWRAEVTSEVLSAPRTADGVVVVYTIDGRVFGLNASDGKRIWVYDRSAPVLTLRGTSSPVLARGAVIGGFDSGKLAALGLNDGRALWEATIAVPRGRSEIERMVDIDADPVIADGVVYVVTFQGRVAAVELSSGRIQWVRDMSSHVGLGVDFARLYVTDESSNVWALDQRNGASLWKQDALHDRALSAPAVYRDYVVVGDFEGYLHWLGREDGSIAARVRLDDTAIVTPMIVSGDVLYAYSRGGKLAAYQIGTTQ